MTINLLPFSSPLLPALKTPHVAIVAPRIIKHHITSVFFSTFSAFFQIFSVLFQYFFLSIFEYLSLPALKTPHVTIVAPRIIKHHRATIGILKLKSIFVNGTEKILCVHGYQDNTNTNTLNRCPSHH